MADFLWLLQPIIWSVVGLWLMPRLTQPQKIVAIILVVVGVPLAYLNHRSQLAVDNHISSVDHQLSDPQTGLIAINNGLNDSRIQSSTLAGELAPYLKPGLQQDALKLGSTLTNRGSQILVLTASQHGTLARREQFVTEQNQLMNDYKNVYAKQVIDLRQRFLDQGLDWNNEQYYSNPTDAREVANVGMDLIRHANQLK